MTSSSEKRDTALGQRTSMRRAVRGSYETPMLRSPISMSGGSRSKVLGKMVALRVAVTVTGMEGVGMSIPQRAGAGAAGLTSVASERFPHQTEAERKLLQFVDSDNQRRGQWVYARRSANPSAPDNFPENA